MPFVKLDQGILRSTLWIDHDARDIFITALLMAEPHELREPMMQVANESCDDADFEVPPGWYGFVEASGPGIVRFAGLDKNPERFREGMEALWRLGAPDPESRTPDFDGRRLVRVDGGYIVLNFQKYRDRDYTTVERSRRYRLRLKQKRQGKSRRD